MSCSIRSYRKEDRDLIARRRRENVERIKNQSDRERSQGLGYWAAVDHRAWAVREEARIKAEKAKAEAEKAA